MHSIKKVSFLSKRMYFLSLLFFRNCNDLRFCSENIDKTHPVFSIVDTSVNFANNEYTAQFNVDGTQSDFTLHIYKIKDSGFRFRIDPGTTLSSYRFDLTHDNIVLNSSTISEKQTLNYGKKNSLDQLVDPLTNETCIISYSPFSVTFSRNDVQYLTFNSHDFLYIETGEAVTEKSENEIILSEESTKHGKTGVGIDISFLSPDTRLSGFSEGTYPINLQDTTEPERRYTLDGYARYGFIPLMIGHCQEFGEIAPSFFWMNPTDLFIDIKTRSNERTTKLVAEGGFIDIVIFMSNMSRTLQEYTLLTGNSPLPPIFALGYHQSKYGYESQEYVENVLAKLEEFKFPNDVLWLDIDYLQNHAPFTINFTWFPDPQRLFKSQLAKKRYVVRITDPHLPIKDDHPQYKSAHDKGYFETNSSGQEAHADCWPGMSAWPDFFRSEVRDWWAQQFSYETDSVGWLENVYLWNDMNEISAFGETDTTAPKDWMHINNAIEERETHDCYGIMMVAASYKGLLQRDNYTRRPFILTRSFYAGSQKYTFYWSGDNTANWEHLRYSIEMALTAGITGIPFTGSDIGGFNNQQSIMTDQLHTRWFQAAAYVYPFFRQHCSNDSPHREPYLTNATNPTAFNAMLKATQDRYRLIGVWYTAAYHHTLTSQPVVAPLWYHYPNNDQYHDVRFQSILDGKIMACPVVEEDASTIDIIKPEGKWYELWTGIELNSSKTISVNISDVPVYIKGGSIIPVFNETAMTTRDQITKPIQLIIAVDENQYAEGDLYLDDGISFNYTKNSSVHTKFIYSNGHFSMIANGTSEGVNNSIVGLRIYGFPSNKDDTEIGGTHSIDENGVIVITGISYRIDETYETKKIGTDFPLWIIAIIVGVVMLILIIIAGVFVYKLNYKHRPPPGPNQYDRISYTESVEPRSVQNDVTKSVL